MHSAPADHALILVVERDPHVRELERFFLEEAARVDIEDGALDTSADVTCPYCGAEVELVLDPAGGLSQRYVEDCEICCHPWQIAVRWDARGVAHVEATTDHA